MINFSWRKNFLVSFRSGSVTRKPSTSPEVLSIKSSTSNKRYGHSKNPNTPVPCVNSKNNTMKNEKISVLRKFQRKTILPKNPIGEIRRMLKITWKSALLRANPTECLVAKIWMSSINWNGVNCQSNIPARSAQKSCEKSGNGKSTIPSAKKRKTQINKFPFFQKWKYFSFSIKNVK